MAPAIDIGFSNNIYDNPADIVDSVMTMSVDFQAIEIEIAEDAQPAIFDAAPQQYAKLVKGLRELASRRKLKYAVHAAWFGPDTDLSANDKAERRRSIDLAARSISFAADIGANTVICHPGYSNGQAQSQIIENLVSSLNELNKLTTPGKIALCVENMGAQRPKQAVLNLEQLSEVCKHAEVGLCLDVVHLASLCPDTIDLLAAIRTLAPLVRHVHLADTVRPAHRHVPIGKGDLPLVQILAELGAAKYSGEAIVEEFNRGWTPDEYYSAAVAFRNDARSLGLAR